MVLFLGHFYYKYLKRYFKFHANKRIKLIFGFSFIKIKMIQYIFSWIFFSCYFFLFYFFLELNRRRSLLFPVVLCNWIKDNSVFTNQIYLSNYSSLLVHSFVLVLSQKRIKIQIQTLAKFTTHIMHVIVFVCYEQATYFRS
jgi:hypothetical protein